MIRSFPATVFSKDQGLRNLLIMVQNKTLERAKITQTNGSELGLQLREEPVEK